MTALLSIRPEFAEAIFNGTKKFEFRKIKFKKDVDKIKVYVTKPVGKIIGEFTVDSIMQGSPEKLWEKTNKYAGISSESYFSYFNGKEIAFAIKVGKVKRYENPICPHIKYKNFVAPQSFKYLHKE